VNQEFRNACTLAQHRASEAFDQAVALAATPAEALHIRRQIDRLTQENAATVP